MFRLGSLVKRLTDGRARDLGNILTLRGEFHARFDGLELWLEKVEGKANTVSVITLQTLA